MISFPTSTNQGGAFNDLYDDAGNRVYQTDEKLRQFDVSKIKSFNINLNSSIKKQLLDDNSLDISMNSFRIKSKEILGKNFTQFQGEPVETVTGDNQSTIYGASADNPLLTANENPFTIPATILTTVNRYNRIYKTPVTNIMAIGEENKTLPEDAINGKENADSAKSTDNSKNIEYTGLNTAVVSSVFSPTHVMQVVGLNDNVPLLNIKTGAADMFIDIGAVEDIISEDSSTGKKSAEVPIEIDPWQVDFYPDSSYISCIYNYDDGTGARTEKFSKDECWQYDSSSRLIYQERKVTKVSSATKSESKDNKSKPKKSSKPETETKRYYKTKSVDADDFNKAVLGDKGGNWIEENGHVKLKINYNPFDERLIRNSGNCSIRELVRMSHTPNGQLGMSKYKYADFLFCKYIGKVSNNHMITLRRFAHPVGDNIFRYSGKGYLNTLKPGYHGHQENAAIGTLVTWFDTDDNKLEDILNYTVKSTWVEFKSEIQEIDTQANDNESGGLIGMFANSFTPGYNSTVAKGMAGSNSLWKKTGSGLFGGVINKVAGKLGASNAGVSGTNTNAMNKWNLMRMAADKHRVYTPQNTIQTTHKYEGRLELTHEFTLNFSYRLRALDVMNPKTVMLDLLGNILEVTYNRGHFWGGERRFIGPPQNMSGYQKANTFIDKQWDKLEGFIMGFANGTLEWKSILSSLSDMVSSAAAAIKGMAENRSETLNKFAEGARKLAGKFVSSGASKALLGQLKNQLGRPAVYAMDSLLSGAPVGLWHVTIGNPKNPIAAFGNLIMENAKITHSGPLGFDDFPTELKVSCTLKHGRPRDLTEITRMYTKGTSAFYQALDKNKLSEFFTVSNTENGRKIETDLAQAQYAQGIAENLNNIDAQVANIDAEIAQLNKQITDEQNKQNEANQQAAQQNTQQPQQDTTNNGGNQTKSTHAEYDTDNLSEQDNTEANTNKQSTVKTQSVSSSPASSDSANTIAEAQAKIGKLNEQKKTLIESKTKMSAELRENADLQKYLSPNYSSIYGDMDEFIDKMKSVPRLYQDNEIYDVDYYRRGHYIRDEWALRYETLGQDLDTEGRILIDENA